jgi:hypothetical protein
MSEKTPELEQALALASNLSPIEKVRLVEQVMATLERELKQQNKQPKHSLYGLCADLGTAPSAEDIDEVRREMWSNFPREDI